MSNLINGLNGDRIFRGMDHHQPTMDLNCDAVVVGSGAGGAVAAYELARAGLKVIILEAGPWVPSTEFTEELSKSVPRLFQDEGNQKSADGDLGVLQGRCVGGSTVVNAAAAFRTPDSVLKAWVEDHQLTEYSPENMRPFFERVERNLSIHVNGPEERNANARVIEEGCDKLGYSHKPLARNIKDCALTGFCLAGCKADRKQSMLVTYLPWAVNHHDARLFSDAMVTKILTEGDRAVGVQAVCSHNGKKVADLTVRAPRVVLAAGAVQTPLLLQKDNLCNRSGQVGENFACHPSVGMVGRMPDPVYGWEGAVLGSWVDEFAPKEKGGFILETGMGEPWYMAALAESGMGESHIDYMMHAKSYAGMISLIHDENHGRVYADEDGKKIIDYRLHEKNFTSMKKSIEVMSEILFAAGSDLVYLPAYKLSIVKNMDEAMGEINAWDLRDQYVLRYTSFHPQGTARMGVDPTQSVVNPRGESHDLRGLWLTDASIFPTSLMVNPQVTVYTLATMISRNILRTSV